MYRHRRTEKSVGVYRHDLYPLHQVDHFRRICLANLSGNVFQQRKAAFHHTISCVIVRAVDLWNGATRRKSGAGILRFQKINVTDDPIHIRVLDIMLRTQGCSHVNMCDVVARCRIDAIQRLQEHPVLAEPLCQLIQVGCIVTGEAVAQFAEIVASIRMVKATLSLQHRLSAGRSVPCHGNGQQCIADGTTLAQRLSTTARTFDITACQIDALCDRTMHLFCVEASNLSCRHRSTEDAENRTWMEPA